ncbi:sphinganine kinase lcb4 [Recurvomyces mirabilis]|uniref:Sphinganine kinase lcb4 n=1 Tax=Recurvomyces mirabilis TaxID=574656 RepID=A0AAE0WI34_9PEZI|nr:sphinganine kinase lcb4 [Recurvomyces mirabilis]KAK5159866.1 sphinganine kinase lcb4 [Recurvomyces mirabilis]
MASSAPNPFDDPAGSGVDVSSTTDMLTAAAVLNVDRNATLTLGTDALIVLDDGLKHRRRPDNLCGLLPQLSKTTRAVPFYNILWAELSDFEITIKYAQPSGKKACKVGSIHYSVTDKSLYAHAKQWVAALVNRAYPSNTKRRKRIKVLVNPFGGQGKAQQLWTREVEPIFAAAQCDVDVEKTAYRGHAKEIAEKMDVDAFDVVACASGDGLPHEVFNGLAKQKYARKALRQVAVTQIPCGSGNALSLNINGTDSPSLAAVAIVKGVRTPMDLMAITQGSERYYSFLSQAVGIVAESDLGTETLRWMGPFRFTWGILIRIVGQTIYPAEVSIVLDSSDKHAIRESYRHAVSEHQSALDDNMTLSPDEDTRATFDTELLPGLKYGTVADPLPATFETADLPTLGNFYTGNMVWMSPDAPFFQAALPADGKMDMINIDGMLSRMTALRMLSSVEHGKLMAFPEVSYRKVLAYRISPRMAPTPSTRRVRAKIGRWLGGAGKQKQGLVAVDGESVPFEPFQVEVVPSLGTVLSKRGAIYELDPALGP